MSERDRYQHGVPCWVDTWQPDLEAAVAFYAGLFGWDAEETCPPGADRRHFMCMLRGRRVTGIGSPPPISGHTPVWGTYVWVDDVEYAVAKAKEAGGMVALEPFDALDGGRLAVLVDPTGAVIAFWQAIHRSVFGGAGVSASTTARRPAALRLRPRSGGQQ